MPFRQETYTYKNVNMANRTHDCLVKVVLYEVNKVLRHKCTNEQPVYQENRHDYLPSSHRVWAL